MSAVLLVITNCPIVGNIVSGIALWVLIYLTLLLPGLSGIDSNFGSYLRFFLLLSVI